MKKILSLWMLLLLMGCHNDIYTKEQYISDTRAMFGIDGEITSLESDSTPLHLHDMIPVLLDLSHSENDYLMTLGCFTKEELIHNPLIDQQRGQEMNRLIFEDLMQRNYFETTFDIGDITSVDVDEDLKHYPQGLYEQNGMFYEVTEHQEVNPFEPHQVDIQTTFNPDLSSSIILPEGVEVPSLNLLFQKNEGIEPLASRYFQFSLNSYQISGRVYSEGIQLKIKRKNNGITVENDLTIEDLKCTLDLSLEKQKYYFRVDYSLEDTLKVSKEQQLYQDKIKLKSFEEIKEKLASLTNNLPLVEDELHLLTFQFEVPSTGKLVKIIMDLSLKLMVNGEVAVTFSSSSHQGTQSFQDELCHLNYQQFEVKPYIEGAIECASVLNFDLKLGTLHLADVAMQGGVGADVTGTVHFVDEKKQFIESVNYNLNYDILKTSLGNYDPFNEIYVDYCADVNVYYFARLKANQKTSLLRKLGLYGSLTPLKDNLSLFHIENQHVVENCTKANPTFYQNEVGDTFDISSYQAFLNIGDVICIESSEEKCAYQSSHPHIVSVDENGNVMALASGEATITITSQKGDIRHCLVLVY